MNMIFRAIALLTLCGSSAWAWTIEERDNENFPGRAVEIRHGGKLVAELIHGEGQFKPYVSVYDAEERRLTNPGMDAAGEFYGRFPHHRGIFIGWNQIASDLGRDDLWHLRGGEQMKVHSIERKETTEDAATVEVIVHWLSATQENDQGGLLVTERRTIIVSRANGRTQVDQRSELTATRDLRLGGDLQHAGLHFRADAAVADVSGETSYLWEPRDLPAGGGRIVSDDLKWVNFRFPLHGGWYAVTQLNPPETRANELSWRDYGRFGFFFQTDLKEGESRVVEGRFLIGESSETVDEEAVRGTAQGDYDAYLKERSDAS